MEAAKIAWRTASFLALKHRAILIDFSAHFSVIRGLISRRLGDFSGKISQVLATATKPAPMMNSTNHGETGIEQSSNNGTKIDWPQKDTKNTGDGRN
jgi:hypothetical protein